MNISEILKARAENFPHETAIIDRTRKLSFAELDLEVARAAALLQRSGLAPGDGVLIFQAMSAELYIALAAIFRLGLTAIFLDPGAGREHIERCCALYRPKALIASSKAHCLRLLSPALRLIPWKFTIGFPVPGARNWATAKNFPPFGKIYPCAPQSPALITFTSGSTGEPKAAVRTHQLLRAQHRALEEAMPPTPGAVDLTTLPLFALANLASGMTSLIPDVDLRHPGSIDPAPLVSQIQACRAQRTVASPALLERLADYCLNHGMTLPAFTKIFSGGAPVFPHLLAKLHSALPNAEIITVYGSTEAEPIALISHRATEAEEMAAMLGGSGMLVGRPIRTIQLRILRDEWGKPIGPYSQPEFARACLPKNRPGEIVVSGEHVLPGYLHGRGDRENKFAVDGIPWHRTGDAGYLDSTGRLWLLGRCSARIDDHRGRIYPFSIECAALNHKQIRRAALVSHNGRRVLAVEICDRKSILDLNSLKQSLGGDIIDEIRVLRSIPVDKRHNAKIDYPALRDVLKSYRFR